MDSARMHVLLAVARASDRRRFVEYLRESDSLHLTVETVGSLARCLETLAESPFDAVVLDTDLPDAPSEIEAMQRLLDCAGDVPAIILGTDAEAAHLAAALDSRPGVEVLPKSIVVLGVLSPAIVRVAAASGRPRAMLSSTRRAAEAEALVARGLAHDFNNLLGVIAANVEMARTSEGDWLDEALETIGEARSLARQLLTVRERRAVAMERLNASDLLRGTLRLLRASLSPAVATTVQIEGGAPDVTGDRVQLSRVLTNLLLNARDAVLERSGHDAGDGYVPEIALRLGSRTDATGSWVDIAIEDNGPGISREKVVRIFEPFFTTKGAHGGSGLGLATCRRIVAEHGGDLTVTTIEGEGTRFLVSLPALMVPPPRDASDVTPNAEANGATVLLVDDEHRVVRVLALALEREGYRVLTATSAADALRLTESGHVDAVLLDVWMPHVDGWQTLTRLRAGGFDAPVVLMSGFPLDTDPRARDAAAVLAKPFTIAELVSTVGSAVSASISAPVAIAS